MRIEHESSYAWYTRGILCGDAEIVVAGGMEEMSWFLITPIWEQRLNLATTLIDRFKKDGLVDAYDNNAMGVWCWHVLQNTKFTPKTKAAIQSYERSAKAG
jgi:acetyl-CoA C-acetyltransferase